MKLLGMTLTILCALEAQAVASPLKNGRHTLHVMSWNVRFDNPRDGENAWPHRKDWVANEIALRDVDVLGLQEVLEGQLTDLKSRLPAMNVYGVGRDDGKCKGEFAPILFRKDRFELLDKDTFWLSETPEKVASRDWDAAITRIASWVKLRDRRTERVFYFINTHFDHRGVEARKKSAELLIRYLNEKFREHPVILAGDFNTTPGSEPYHLLVDASPSSETFRDARVISARSPEGPNSTWNGFRGIQEGRRIDFVFVTKRIKVLQHDILVTERDGRFASDHLPVLTILKLSP